MSDVLRDLERRGLVHFPGWLHPTNVIYLTIFGSTAYGCSDTNVKDKVPDFDIYGVAIPPKDKLFPSLGGHILGFGEWKDPTNRIHKDDPWQQHHVFDKDANAGKGKEWDFNVYGIVRYFELLRGNNPNIIGSIFTPENCVIHITNVGRHIRDNRRKFYGKIVWKTFRSYALGQLKKASNKMEQAEMKDVIECEDQYDIPHSTTFKEVEKEMAARGTVQSLSKLSLEELQWYRELFQKGLDKNTRFEDNKKYQMDRKFLYNIVRLYDEADQIISGNGEYDLDIQRSKEVMKAVRRGEWTTQQIHDFVAAKDPALEAAYSRCTLPEYPDELVMRKILMECLEMHYGNLSAAYAEPDWSITALRQVADLIDKNRLRLFG
jgi:predicted nucleotidyltransferase